MSVVVVPPTPRKASPLAMDDERAPPAMGISSQILPLSRLSLSSGGGGGISPTSSQDSANDAGGAGSEVRGKANGDTSSSSVDSGSPPSEDGAPPPGDGRDPKSWPVKDKLLKLRKSFTEPLVQYFQELQVLLAELIVYITEMGEKMV